MSIGDRDKDFDETTAPRGVEDSEGISGWKFGERFIAGMTMWVLLLAAGLAFGVDGATGGSDDMETAADRVLGASEAARVTTTTTAPPPTSTTLDPLTAYLATSTTTTTVPPTTTTTTTTVPPSTTTTMPVTTTTAPSRATPGSATATSSGLRLALDVLPGDQPRSVVARLAAGFEDGRVLRAVRVDFGDGTVTPQAVEAFECWAPDAPNPHEVALPAHAYAAPGTYTLTVVATTALCSPEDDDWGPEEQAEVRLDVIVS